MEDVTRDIRRNREDHYFLEREQRRMEEMRRQSEREAETLRLMEAFGIREPEIVRDLADAGFDTETFRLLYLTPLIQVAWSDGDVSRQEREQVLRIANLRGIKTGSSVHERLLVWLTERPSDRFFQVCLRGLKAALRHRPPSEAEALHRELVWECTGVASASGGFFSLGSRISRDEERMLIHIEHRLVFDSEQPRISRENGC